MRKHSDFAPTMLAFLRWYFRTLDPKFTTSLFKGRSVEEAAEQVLKDIVAKVRGNRAMEGQLTVGDYGAIMDRVAALHLQTRHGEDAVSDSVVP